MSDVPKAFFKFLQGQYIHFYDVRSRNEIIKLIKRYILNEHLKHSVDNYKKAYCIQFLNTLRLTKIANHFEAIVILECIIQMIPTKFKTTKIRPFYISYYYYFFFDKEEVIVLL